ncbi:hypothetical protein [Alkalihalobacterium sp. APHAB7]|jgi:hypothetical protein|uniref:hypothetical protein n=1 Tax=Alkalihalobacterium sp. APHAB7 TaxID=3402081 RepID=UPI003AAA9C8D
MFHLTQEDQNVIQEAIYYPLVRKVMEHDLKKLTQAGLKFSEPYTLFVESRIHDIGKEISRVNRELKNKGIRIEDRGTVKDHSVGWCVYVIHYQGYSKEMKILDRVIKNTVGDFMMNYIAYNTLHSGGSTTD